MQGSVTRLRTDQLTLNLRPAENHYRWDESYGIGFNLGVYKTIGDHWAVGAMYKSKQWATPLHEYRDLAPDSLEYPQEARIGAAWMPNDRLAFTADYEFQQWSSVPPFGVGVLKSGLAWHDLHAFKAGIEYEAIKDKLTLMGGFSISRPVVDRDHTFVNAFIPTLIEKHLTLGATWELDKKNSFTLVYLRSFENTFKQSRNGDLLDTLGGAGSELTVAGNSIAIGYSHKF